MVIMMTERFMVDDAGTLIDMQTRDMFDIVEEVCPLLNELSEENEQLKTFLESLREELSLADRDNTTLEKENEQLKQAYNDAKKDVEKKEQILKYIMKDNLLIQDIGKELE